MSSPGHNELNEMAAGAWFCDAGGLGNRSQDIDKVLPEYFSFITKTCKILHMERRGDALTVADLSVITSIIKCRMKWLIHSQTWSLGMDKSFHHTLHNGCDYLSMLRLTFIDVSKGGPALNAALTNFPLQWMCDIDLRSQHNTTK